MTHAWGAADETPGQIRQLRSDIHKQGTRHAATCSVAWAAKETATRPPWRPLLLELLADETLQEKDEIVFILVQFAIGFAGQHSARGIDPQEAFARAEGVRPERCF